MTPTDPPSDADRTLDSADDGSDDPRLMAAMQEYMAALDAGKRINRRELIGRHPDIAAELSACLQGLAFVHGATDQLADAGGGPPPSVLDAAAAGPRTDGLGDDAPGASPAPTVGLNGTPLGDFRLLREIGRGGMGVVYEATQLSLGRRVAVKVLPMAAALDARRLQRFRNEAQAAAGLHHTNIVPVYAVGSDRSTHFYAMQLIDGRSLAEVIRELRQAEAGARRRSVLGRRLLDQPDPTPADPATASLATTAADRTVALATAPAAAAAASPSTVSPSSAWSGPRAADPFSTLHGGRRSEYFRTVARLGVQAAEALDYAHGLGIIHRDVKPANLMVDGRGNLWVTDFGLAQMQGDNGLTQTGDMVGTFRYMSPEQAGGGPGRLGTGRRHRRRRDADADSSGDGVPEIVLDPRTDVYSLGVTLYELLTLQAALPGKTRDDLMVQLAVIDPRPARAIDRAIPVELQTVLAKAYAKDPADRYATAHAFADDLRRFLADEPIHARPPTVWDHAAKWTRRHRSVALSAIVILTLAAGGLGASTIVVGAERVRAQAGEASARTQAAQAAHARDAADAARREAQAERDEAGRNYVQARRAIDELTRVADDLPNIPATADTRRVLLQTARDYYQQFATAGVRDPASLQASQRRAESLLAELVATDQRYRVRYDIGLLRLPPVRQDLGLTAAEADAAQDLADRMGGPGPDADARKPGSESADRLRASLASVLTRPGQLDRLGQVSRQVRGVQAFEYPEVVDRLDYTPEQATAIRKLCAATGAAGGHWADGGRFQDEHGRGRFGGDGHDDRHGHDDGHGRDEFDRGGGPDDRGFGGGPGDGGPMRHRDTGVQQVLALLTPKQTADWHALTGPPFKASATNAPRGRPDDDGPPG